jgi:hypothetical protein
MGVNRSRVRALHKKANGQLESFPLRDGSRYYFDRQQAALAIFMYAFDKTLREEGSPVSRSSSVWCSRRPPTLEPSWRRSAPAILPRCSATPSIC